MKIGGRDAAQPHQRDACRRKVQHLTEDRAEAECRRVWRWRGVVVFTYRCKWCGFWHLTKHVQK